MQGKVAYRPPQRESHNCLPPMKCAVLELRERDGEPLPPRITGWRPCGPQHEMSCAWPQAAEPVGSIWQCECGAFWTVYQQKNHPNSNIYVDYDPEWRPATWSERRRARRELRLELGRNALDGR